MRNPFKKTAGSLLALVLLLTTIGCDRVTKHLATTNLAEKPGKSYFRGAVRLEYAENPGAFLSLGARLPEPIRVGLFRFGVGAALAAIAFVALKQRWTGPRLMGATLILAGGGSNLIDRLLHGTVVDFVSIGIGPLHSGIFNIADIAIISGAALVAVGSGEFFRWRHR